MHPSETKSEIGSSHSSACKSKSVSSSVSPILQEMLVLPHLKQTTGRKRRALNSEGLCITDSEVLDGPKAKEEEKMEKQRKKSEGKEQRKARSLEIERRKAEAEEKRKAKEIQRKNMTKKPVKSQQTRRGKDMDRRGKRRTETKVQERGFNCTRE